jgi:thiamine-phosphate pyrophosphorylase
VRPPLPRLHAITDERIARRADLEPIVAQLETIGSDIAWHARGRALSGREHYDLAVRLARPPDRPPAHLFVNDRLDVALATGATGVQLRQDSLPVAAARALHSDWWIGRSVHSLEEAQDALAQGADYLVAGPMYATVTHPGSTSLPTDTLHAIARLGAPVIAIGGVTPARLPELRAAGIHGVAVIRALWDAPDPASAARDLLAGLEDR